jgi:hypothetical protein
MALFVGLASHLAAHLAARQADRRYREMLGAQRDEFPPTDEWVDVRPLAGGWGCLSIVLVALRAAGLTVALGTASYLVIR